MPPSRHKCTPKSDIENKSCLEYNKFDEINDIGTSELIIKADKLSNKRCNLA